MVKQTINVVSRQSKAKESRFVMHKIHRQQPSKRVGELGCPKSNNGRLNRAMKATSKSIMKVQRVCSIFPAGDLLKHADNISKQRNKGWKASNPATKEKWKFEEEIQRCISWNKWFIYDKNPRARWEKHVWTSSESIEWQCISSVVANGKAFPFCKSFEWHAPYNPVILVSNVRNIRTSIRKWIEHIFIDRKEQQQLQIKGCKGSSK